MNAMRSWRRSRKTGASAAPVVAPKDSPARKAKPALRTATAWPVAGATASFTGKKTHTTNRAAQRVARKVRRVAREIFRHGNKTRRARRARAAEQPARRAGFSLA